ncbi:NAD-dependent epimerase/dehydratase family protein [Streptomyces adustus]|uniref:NAD-dependent epimerase/dehydratase family protein n=1 Tax=Streptomyces adustus TaxID=1609272 RepID=A0A5N8VRN9_9ACTN|nr:NAD(P)H-binding protein [Streptomyces adustus]MPY37961.1 NAD-dependent epimerase/dehydratase family protein [Streptomyces adustus]
MSNDLILVTGAGGPGSIGRKVVERLRKADLPVRAMVRQNDDRAESLRATGAEVVIGDLTRPDDVARALDGARRLYFGMSVSSAYLEAAATVASIARDQEGLEAFVNMSQMTVSQMTLTSTSESRHQRLHLLTEHILSWSGLPVVEVRPTIFMENPLFAFAIAPSADGYNLQLPFGTGRTSPVSTEDVADVVAAILTDPAQHVGQVYELTGPVSRDLNGVAEEFAKAVGRPVTYVDIPFDGWVEFLNAVNLPDHLLDHVKTMARLHRENRYDRVSGDVQKVLGRPALDARDFAANNLQLFQ